MNMKPETTESVYRLTIKPAVMIGNPILEAFPEEAQRRKFPNSMLQNSSMYSTRIALKSKNNEHNSSSQHESNNVEFDRFRKPDLKNCNDDIKIHRLTNHALSQLIQFQNSNPKFFKLSDNLIRSLLRLKHNNISLKDVRLQFTNNQNRTREMKNAENFDHEPRKSNVFNSNAIINSLSNSKKERYATEKRIFNTRNWNFKVKNNTFLKSKGRYRNNINATETKFEKEIKKLKIPVNISNKDHIIFDNIKSPHFEDTILKATKSDAITPQINNWIYKFIIEIVPAFRLNSTAAKISNKTTYITNPEMVTVANGSDINRNLNVIDVNRTQSKKTVHATVSTTGKIDGNYSSMKIEKLLYESKSPNVELHRYFPNINRTFTSVDSINKTSIDSLTSNHNSIQQNRDRSKKKCSTNKMHKQSNSTFERFYKGNGSSTESNDKIDFELINFNKTPESITIDDCAYSKESQESIIIEKGSKDAFDVLTKTSAMRTPDAFNEDVMRNENESRKKETEKHSKHKYKDRHNDHKNNKPKKGKKNHNAKRKYTSTASWIVDETTSVDYSNDYSLERRKAMSSRNDPGYDKADGNRNTSTSKSDWHLTDEITTEPLKMESSNVDETVTEHFTKDNTKEGLQSEERTNTDLITDNTIFYSSTVFKEQKFKKCKIQITTTTENSWWYAEKIDNEKDEELVNCEDVTSFPVTSDFEDKTETGNYNVLTNDDYLFADEKISTSTSATSFSTNFNFTKNDELSSVEKIATYSTITNKESKNRNSTTEKSILDEKSVENNERIDEWSWYGESITHPVTRSITQGAVSNLDSEEGEDSSEKLSTKDNEIDNGVMTPIEDIHMEDYEIDNCNNNQYACDKYTCIDDDEVCDGIVDCINASDEINCDYMYIKRWEEHQRVNEQPEKFDLSSQNSIENTLLDGCSRYEHPCDDMCINALNVCDGKRDCLDGTDEEDCLSLEGTSYIESNISWMISISALRLCCKKFLA